MIVVFTDGNEHFSMLTSDTAILRAKTAGVLVYTIAQGEALDHPEFLKAIGRCFESHRWGSIRHSRAA